MPASADESLVSELYDLRTQIDRIVADARKLTTNVSDRQFNWRAEAGKWSMSQCLAHLNAAGAWFLPRIDSSIREARKQGLLSNGPYRHGFLGNYFVRLSEPPPKQRFRAPRTMAPATAEPPEKTIPEFFALQDRIQDRILSANGIDLGRAKVESPIARWI